MKTRKWIFLTIALFACLWITYGASLSSSAFTTVVSQSSSADKGAATVGAGLGAGLGLTFFACTGAPVLLLALFIAWRCQAGINTERRHQEQLAAIQGQPIRKG